MGLRLLEYNVLADREYDCPVISCVTYLLKDIVRINNSSDLQPPAGALCCFYCLLEGVPVYACFGHQFQAHL